MLGVVASSIGVVGQRCQYLFDCIFLVLLCNDVWFSWVRVINK